MNKHHEKAKTIFEAYSGKDTVHFASDGTPFFEPNAAANHAKSLEDKGVSIVERHEVMVKEEEEEEDEEGTLDSIEEGRLELLKESAERTEKEAAAEPEKGSKAKDKTEDPA